MLMRQMTRVKDKNHPLDKKLTGEIDTVEFVNIEFICYNN